MISQWSHFDSLMIPLVISDPEGRVLYKNDLAKSMRIVRVGGRLVKSMQPSSAKRFAELSTGGAILTLLALPDAYRCLAIPFSVQGEKYVGMLFADVLLGNRENCDNEQWLLKMTPSLRRMLTEITLLPYTLGRSVGKKAATTRLITLMRKVLDVYLSGKQREDAEMPVGVGYFLSVLTYFFREVFKYQGVTLAVSETAKESEFVFFDHRELTAMLLSVIELIIDRSGSDRMYIDIYSEAGQAVVMFSAVLNREWVMPDDSLPDGFILLSLLKRYGIEHEFYTTVSEDSARMICRLFLPVRIAKPSLRVQACCLMEEDRMVTDFIEYLNEGLTCAQ